MEFGFGVRLAGDHGTRKLNATKTRGEIKHGFCGHARRPVGRRVLFCIV